MSLLQKKFDTTFLKHSVYRQTWPYNTIR